MALTPNPLKQAKYSASLRVAVIIAVLGEDAARPIVEKLDDVALAKVSSALEDISLLPREALMEIVMDFLGVLRSASNGLDGGRVQAKDLITRVVETRRDDPSRAGQEASDRGASGHVWASLEKSPVLPTAQYLNGLSASLVALILRKLSSERSSQLICHLSEDKLLPVMGYMVEAIANDPAIEAIVARMIDMEFLSRDEAPDEDGQEHLESLGEILTLIPAAKRDGLMEFIRSRYDSKLNGIQKSMFTIEGLPDMLPREVVPIAFRDMETGTITRLIASMQGPYSAVAEFLLANISTRLAGQIRDEIKDLPPISETETETLHRDFLSLLMAQKRAGKFTVA